MENVTEQMTLQLSIEEAKAMRWFLEGNLTVLLVKSPTHILLEGILNVIRDELKTVTQGGSDG